MPRVSTPGDLGIGRGAGKLEHGDPYAVRDAMLRADPVELGGLEFNDRLRHLGQAESKINSLEAEARARESERKAAEREAKQALMNDQRFAAHFLADNTAKMNDAMNAGRPKDPEVVKATSLEFDRQIASAIDPDVKYSLAKAREEFHATVDGTDYARTAAGIPTPQLASEVARLQSQMISPTEQTPESDKLVTASRILKDRMDALREGKTLEHAQDFGLQLAPIDPSDPQSAVVREEQSAKVAYFNGLPFTGNHQRLTEAEASHIAEDINGSATTDEVFSKLDGYMGRLDDNAKRAWLRELKAKKLSPMVERAMEALNDRGDVPGARAIAAALTVKPEDLPKLGDATAKEITDAVNAELTGSGNLAGLSSRDAMNTQQPGMFTRSAEDRDALLRMTQHYVQTGQDALTAAKSAARDLFGDGTAAGSEDLQYVRPPKGEDADQFTAILERARANVVLPEFGPQPGDPPGRDLYRDSNLQNIRDNGYWRQGPGGTYELVDPTTNRTVAAFTPSQLRSLATNEAFGAVPMPSNLP
jgi:hypothetical protein